MVLKLRMSLFLKRLPHLLHISVFCYNISVVEVLQVHIIEAFVFQCFITVLQYNDQNKVNPILKQPIILT